MTLAELMNIPYKDYGRDLQGADCWGFVRLVRYHHHRLPLLASFGSISPDNKNGMTDSYKKLVDGFVQTKPVNGAIACHFIHNTLYHVGVVVDENGLKVAHSARKTRKPVLTRLIEFERMALDTRYYIENGSIGCLSKQTRYH